MLPYIEQATLYNAFNAALGSEGPLISSPPPGFTANSTVSTTKISSFQCPSDNQNNFVTSTLAVYGLPGLDLERCRREITPSTGATPISARPIPARRRLFTSNPSLHLATPFGINTAATGPSLVKVAIDHRRNEQHGVRLGDSSRERPTTSADVWISLAGGSCFMTRFTPNSYQDYVPLHSAVVAGRRSPSAGARQTSIFAGVCDSQPVAAARVHRPWPSKGATSPAPAAGIPAESTSSLATARSASSRTSSVP